MAKNVSNQFKNIIKNGGPFYAYAAVTFADGSQTIMNSKTDFMATGNGYSESSEAGFPLGVAISKTITLNIDNTTAYESIQDTEGRHIQDTTGEDILANKKSVEEDYYNARIVLYTEADLPDGTQERIQEGIFTVIDSVRPDEVLEITAYDDMYKADVAFYSSLTYPVSVQMLLNEVCNFCDITLGSATFKNNDYQIHQAPQNLTARQVIGYIAQIAGGNAVIDRNGRLVIKSYDLSGFDASEEISSDEIESESGIHIFSRFTSAPDIGVADVIITGVSTEVEDENGEDEVYLVGTEEYAISVDNPLITGNEQDAVNRIAESIMGLRLRPFSGNFLPDPTVEFMDLCYVIDRKDNIYKSFVTLHDFDYLGGSMFANETESPQKFGGTYYSEAAQAYQKAKEDIKNNKKQWEQAIENLSQQVANSSGLYTTKEEQPDGSTIFYMHNKPTLEESDIVWKMTAETLTVSTDGGKTWNAGITVNGEVIARILSTIGINFDWGVGGTLIIQDTDGNQTAYIDADTGEIRLTVTSLSIQGKNVNEIAADEIENFISEVYDPEIENLQNQIDKKSETWYQPTDPSLQWTETEESALQDTTGADILDTNGEQIIGILEIGKTVHEGDLWKDSDTNVEYIYQDGQWIEMPIPDAVFDEIDGKARIFVTTPVPPYSERDLWMQGPDGDIMTCVHGRESGSFVSSDWEIKQKYTDDTAVGILDASLDKEGVFNRLTDYGKEEGMYIRDGHLYFNGTYIQSGAIQVVDDDGNIIFKADIDNHSVTISGDRVFIGDQPITENFDNLQNQIDSIDASENIYYGENLIKDPYFTKLSGEGNMWAVNTGVHATRMGDDYEIKDPLGDSGKIMRIWKEPTASAGAFFGTKPTNNPVIPEDLQDGIFEFTFYARTENTGSGYVIWTTDIYVCVNGYYSSYKKITLNKLWHKYSIKLKCESTRRAHISFGVAPVTSGESNAILLYKPECYYVGQDIKEGANLIRDPHFDTIKSPVSTGGMWTTPNSTGIDIRSYKTSCTHEFVDPNIDTFKDPEGGYGALVVNNMSNGVSDCFVSAISNGNNPVVTDTGMYRVSVWLKAQYSGKTLKLSLNRQTTDIELSTEWKEYSYIQNIETVNAQGYEMFTIGGFGSWGTNFGDLYIYNPRVEKLYSAEDTFNMLTDFGKKKGMYMIDGQLYFSFDYAKGGALKLGGVNNGNGLLEIYDADGNLVGRINNVGTQFWQDSEWIKIKESLLTGGHGGTEGQGGTEDGILDLSANYDNNEYNVVLESKTGDVILKTHKGDIRVEQDRVSNNMGYLIQSGDTGYIEEEGIEVIFGEMSPIRYLSYVKADTPGPIEGAVYPNDGLYIKLSDGSEHEPHFPRWCVDAVFEIELYADSSGGGSSRNSNTVTLPDIFKRCAHVYFMTRSCRAGFVNEIYYNESSNTVYAEIGLYSNNVGTVRAKIFCLGIN